MVNGNPKKSESQEINDSHAKAQKPEIEEIEAISMKNNQQFKYFDLNVNVKKLKYKSNKYNIF